MSDLPKPLRDRLAADFQLWTTRIVHHKQTDDGTEKLLVELHDGQQIECVLLRDGARRTICISTQVGCAMGCVFCASGLDGVVRNLSAGEIVEQMLLLDRLLPEGERLSHIVVMGMGEPLANLDALARASAEASSPTGLGISPRRITISTVGLPPAIHRLAEANARYNLAVSLHAPDDELRNRLVKVNKNIGLAEILRAADHYFEASGRRLTFEYVLLAGINDSPDHARRLVALLDERAVLVNVIPYNPVAELRIPHAFESRHAALRRNARVRRRERLRPRAQGRQDRRRLRTVETSESGSRAGLIRRIGAMLTKRVSMLAHRRFADNLLAPAEYRL